MPRVCTICSHPEQQEIDKALVGGQSVRAIAAIRRVSEDALQRHKAHVGRAIVRASERREEALGDTLLGDLQSLRQKTLGLLEQAEKAGNVPAIVALIKEARQNVSALSELAEKADGSGQRASAGPALRCVMTLIGQDPTHEWDLLPDAWRDLLPGKPEGKLYIVRPHVNNGKGGLGNDER